MLLWFDTTIPDALKGSVVAVELNARPSRGGKRFSTLSARKPDSCANFEVPEYDSTLETHFSRVHRLQSLRNTSPTLEKFKNESLLWYGTTPDARLIGSRIFGTETRAGHGRSSRWNSTPSHQEVENGFQLCTRAHRTRVWILKYRSIIPRSTHIFSRVHRL